MAIKLLSVLMLLTGCVVSLLFYSIAPMAQAAGCLANNACPPLSIQARLWQSGLPLGVAVILVALALTVNRYNRKWAKLILVVPIALISLWIFGSFGMAVLPG